MSAKKAKKSSYAEAGVDIDEMMSGLQSIKKMVAKTSTPAVLSDIGSFGGLHTSPGKSEILVASADGVGTKLKVASMADRHDTVGQCLINHCVNDILVQGARPLFFLDYLGTAKLAGHVFKDVIKGLTKACMENGCALLGGETAEMPGLYPAGEYDLVGTIVGSVPKKQLITGERIRSGDVIEEPRSDNASSSPKCGYCTEIEVPPVFSACRCQQHEPLGVGDNLRSIESVMEIADDRWRIVIHRQRLPTEDAVSVLSFVNQR